MKLVLNETESTKDFLLSKNIRDRISMLILLSVVLLPVTIAITFIGFRPGYSNYMQLAGFIWLIYFLIVAKIVFFNKELTMYYDKTNRELLIKNWLGDDIVKVESTDLLVMRRRYRLYYLLRGPINPELGLIPPDYSLNLGNIVFDLNGDDFNRNPFSLSMGSYWYEVTDNIQLIERWRYGSGSSSLTIGNTTVYDTSYAFPSIARKMMSLDWDFYYIKENQKPIYLYSSTFNQPLIMHQLAEEITDTLQINLIDDTGEVPEVREYGKRNDFVGIKLKNSTDFRAIDEKEVNLINILEDDGKYKIKTVADPINDGGFLKLILGSFIFVIGLVFSLILINVLITNLLNNGDLLRFFSTSMFLIVITLAMILGGFHLMRFSFDKSILIIDKDNTVLKGQVLFLLRTLAEIPTKAIEDVNVVQVWQYTRIEIVSDINRLFIPGKYNWDQAMGIKQAIESVLVKFV